MNSGFGLEDQPPAGVAKLVDALDLGSSDESRGGSNPSARTVPKAWTNAWTKASAPLRYVRLCYDRTLLRSGLAAAAPGRMKLRHMKLS